MPTAPSISRPPVYVQNFLPIPCVLLLPTCDLKGARSILRRHENEIKALADQGIFPAWDISRVHPSTNGQRTERRFLVRAVRDLAENKSITRDEDLIERLLYGKPRPFILGKDFYAAWNCDSGHMCNLVADGTLQTVKGTTYGQGRGCTPCITWSSAMKFLKDRRIA